VRCLHFIHQGVWGRGCAEQDGVAKRYRDDCFQNPDFHPQRSRAVFKSPGPHSPARQARPTKLESSSSLSSGCLSAEGLAARGIRRGEGTARV
jgi:hypothetical protein